MLIAVPCDSTDGLEATISDHFGHCAAFTLVTIDDTTIGEVSILENSAHEEGGCMAPVTLLKAHGVDALVAGGMGMRPLSGFQQVGIEVYFKENASTVQQAVDLFMSGSCQPYAEAQTCGGGEGHCGGGHHHHHEPETVPIEGKADVRDGRMITLEYELKDGEGNLLNASDKSGPMRFVFGANQVLPPIEKAIFGLEPGAHVVQEIPVDEAFGPHDEERIFEIPRTQLPPDVVVGAVVAGQDRSGRQFPLLILHLDDEIARLDSNHPLAGKDLVFDLTVKNVEALKTA